jgi:hypothetical protein
MSSPWRDRNSSGSDGKRPVEDDQPPAWAERCPGPAQPGDRVGQLVERVLEVGQVERSGHGDVRDVRLTMLIRSAEPFLLDVLSRSRHGVGLELDADELEPRNRRAIAMSQRPPPQWISTTRPPLDSSATA